MVKEKIINETPDARFIRLATGRTQKILDSIRILGNCADVRRYKYNQTQVNRIFSAIEKELKSTKEKFKKTKDEKFSFQ